MSRREKRMKKILDSEACLSKEPFSAATISSIIGINTADTNGILRDMVEANLLRRVQHSGRQGTVTRYVFKTPATKWLRMKWR